MREMRAEGMTLRQIADAAGVSVDTAHRETKDNFQKSESSPKITGADGKARPATYKPRKSLFMETAEAGIEVERPIAFGVLKIKAKLGELMPAESPGGRGKQTVKQIDGFSRETIHELTRIREVDAALASREGLHVGALAVRLGVSQKTIRRNVRLLQQAVGPTIGRQEPADNTPGHTWRHRCADRRRRLFTRRTGCH